MVTEFLFDDHCLSCKTRGFDFKFQGLCACGAQRQVKPRMEGYVENVVASYGLDDFRATFRVDRRTCEIITVLLGEQLKVKHPLGGGRKEISAEKCVLVGLYYLACQETVRKIAEKFHLSEFSVLSCRSRFLKAITSLKQEIIKWPRAARAQEVIKGFKERQGFGAIGAIDGSHVIIRPPKDCPENYINRKGHYSIILQAVCDHEMFFTNIYAGWPGSVHDARVFKRSPLCEKLEVDYYELCPQNSFLLGDAAYPLQPFLLTPFKDNGSLTLEQKQYNFKHSSSRMKIEHAFAALKGRWRRLKFVDICSLDNILDVVLSCCILHNICLVHEEDLMQFMDTEENGNNFETLPLYQNSKDGVSKRDFIMNALCNV